MHLVKADHSHDSSSKTDVAERDWYWKLSSLITRIFFYFAILLGSFIAAGFFILVFERITRPGMPNGLELDTKSEWSSYFFVETGYPVLRIEHGGRNNHVETFSLVGSGRTESWFEGHGFKDFGEDMYSDPYSVLSGILVDNTDVPVITMQHPKAGRTIFWYEPKTGLLKWD